MAIFYIDPTAASGGDGSLAAPFNSWTAVTWTAGNSYLQKCDTVYNGSVGRITISATGTITSPIILSSYGEGKRPVLDGGFTRDVGIFATNHSDIQISNFEIRNYTTAGIQCGSSGNDSSIIRRIVVDNVWVHSITGGTQGNIAGIKWWGGQVRITNTLIEKVEEDGIWCDGQNVTLTNVTIRNISYKNTGFGDCVQFGGTRCSGLIIEKCHMDHLNNDDKQIIVLAGSLETAATFQIRDNVLTSISSGAGCVSIDCVTDPAGGAVFERNIVISNRGLRYANADTNGRNIICKNNLFVAITDGITSTSATAFLSLVGKAYNNTVVGFYRGIEVSSGEVKNNVFYNIGDFDYNASVGGNIANNCYWNVGRHAPSQEGSNNINVDPKLNVNYYPLANSPLINAGVFVQYDRDLSSYFKSNPPSMGAYEYTTPRGVR